MKGRLYRSSTDRVIAGVCGGLGEYLALDPLLVRVFFVVFALGANGVGILLYLALWAVLPTRASGAATLGSRVETGTHEMADRASQMGAELAQAASARDPRLISWIGAGLVLVGAVMFLRSLGLSWLSWLDFDVLWPLLLIVGGLVLLFRRGRSASE